MSALTKPSEIYWCDGSKEEATTITREMLDRGELIKLNEKEYENCYLFRNNPDDVARVEDRTFICTTKKEDAGPTNNWAPIKETKAMLNKLFDGVMKGRTMYVVPYLMGPEGSKYSQVGVELSDSPLVVLTAGVLTRMGRPAIKALDATHKFVRGIHSTGNLKAEDRYICHFTEEGLLMSINTNYGGNAALSKKPHALRLASVYAEREGWLAEHMFTLEVKDPKGKLYYITGALPSGSGKTNLAMIRPPTIFKDWEAKTVGDDLAWLHCDDGTEIRAINPENGFFGVAYGTGPTSNPNILESIKKNTIFTNVGLTPEKTPWWEGLTAETPKGVIDWTGGIVGAGDRCQLSIANKNSRYTTPIAQYPLTSKQYDNPKGVPVSIMIFGGRRESLVPLVHEAYSWEHGILLGTMMRVETTAAQTGKVGEVRQDPMAMLAFCGYNMGDYFKHWVEFGKKVKTKPKVFFVNWFRKDKNGKYMWPGFSENFRIINWMIKRTNGSEDAVETPIGYVPKPESIDLNGAGVTKETLKELLYVDNKGWLNELSMTKSFFDKFGDKMPKELWDEYYKLEKRLKA